MKKKIIIGIHGLNNKPEPELLLSWWKKSIQDGLDKIDFSATKFELELVYWADHNYPFALNQDVSDPTNELFLGEPYQDPRQINPNRKFMIKKKFLDFFEKEMDHIFLTKGKFTGIDKLIDGTVHKIFKDLDNYYQGYGDNQKERLSGPELRNRLHQKLIEHQGKDIFLIAHSMGSIIAYDTLVKYENAINISTFATIGSPLGLSVIIKKILWDRGLEISKNAKVPTPENINDNWYNFADIDDKIAINYNLADDFIANRKGIKPVDFLVTNDYVMNEIRNPHKGYGYLRTKDMAQKIYDFFKK